MEEEGLSIDDWWWWWLWRSNSVLDIVRAMGGVLDGDTDGGCDSMAECGSMLEWREGRGAENKL